ncbi:hypothetical protein [Streptomyces sp. NBC_00094]|uniref:hypothetical protein n=1 Tax=Streptomyces sp. NBC_00094 TaxID=2903620 RepID=UPI0022544F1E|nr:hypothetical protein [Streptomyces sp. NBC_00094]MCX5388495.1 hypothetical protein [Streptomyces sp. NBC_00094]
MQSYRLTWMLEGRDEQQVSTVSYDANSAKHYKARKAAEDGVSEVEIIPVKPGQ